MKSRRCTALLLVLLLAGCQQDAHRRSESAEPLRAAVQERWRWEATPPAYVGMPAADPTGVAFTSALSRLILLDVAGRTLWTAGKAHLRDVAPRLTPDLVTATTEHGLAAFDRADGTARWVAELGERPNTPALGGDTFVASTWEGSLFGVDKASGTVRWRSPIPGPALGPAATDGRIAVVTWVADDNIVAGVVAVDVDTGERRWAVALPPGGVSGPAITLTEDGPAEVVAVAGDLAAHGLDLETGRELWRTPTEGAGSPEVPPLALPGGDVLVAHRLGGLALLDPAGRLRWEVASDGASVRGGPAGPSPQGRFAFPLDDGRLLLAGPEAPASIIDPPGRISGVASGAGGLLLVGTRESAGNGLTASTGW
ncbi:MAG TPA: PQQ-binding-like beta-propeller repeat protein [Acidimicrobiales bacterium]|nr:PQQ-binding-like beta-propeller repeat protein [Acidimicrobiales bacterium]